MTTREEQAAAAKAKADAAEAQAKKDAQAEREANQNAGVASVKTSAASAEISKQDEVKPAEEENANPQFYVHLANGEVLRCEEDQLPVGGGTNAPNGHWVKDGKSFVVVGVYPAENEVK